jgi:hypothetical protein
VYIVHDQHLACITGVSKYFLVAGHAGIETYLTSSGAFFAKGVAMEHMSIGK